MLMLESASKSAVESPGFTARTQSRSLPIQIIEFASAVYSGCAGEFIAITLPLGAFNVGDSEYSGPAASVGVVNGPSNFTVTLSGALAPTIVKSPLMSVIALPCGLVIWACASRTCAGGFVAMSGRTPGVTVAYTVPLTSQRCT